MKITTTLTKAEGGPLVGFAVLPGVVSSIVALLLSALAACQFRGVSYGLGSKAPEPFSAKVCFRRIDCSGFVRWALWVATRGAVLLPDGSYLQNDWCAAQGFKHADSAAYANTALHDGHVRLCFHKPGGRGGDGIGHVWLVYGDGSGEAMTLESYGGHGPGRRPWNHQWFLDHVDDIYVLC